MIIDMTEIDINIIITTVKMGNSMTNHLFDEAISLLCAEGVHTKTQLWHVFSRTYINQRDGLFQRGREVARLLWLNQEIQECLFQTASFIFAISFST